MNRDAYTIDSPAGFRERAESAVRENVPHLERMSPEEVRDFVHDLRVNLAERDLRIEALRQDCEEQARRAADALSLLECSPDVIARFDRNLDILYANPAFQRITGIPEEQAIGHSLTEMEFQFITIAPWETGIRRVFESGEETALEFGYAGTEGKGSYHARIVPEGLENGKPLSVLVIARDITDLAETREKLRESESRFRTVADVITDYAYSFCVDPDGRLDVEWVYGAFEEITGYEPEEANVKTDWTRIIHPDDQEIGQHRIDELLSGNEVKTLLRIVAKEGAVHWMQDNARPIKDEQGRVIRVVGATRDVSNLKHAEEELKITQEDLQEQVWRRTVDLEKTIENLRAEITGRKKAEETTRQNEQILGSVLAALPVGVIVANTQGDILLANPSGYSIWGGAQRGRPEKISYLKGWTDTGKRIEPDEWPAMRSIRLGNSFMNEEIEIEALDGVRKNIINSSIPLRDKWGNITLAVMVSEDITNRKRTERELEGYRKHLEELVQERTAQLQNEIEERKQIEEELRESEGRLDALFNQIPAGLNLLDAQFRYLKVNELAARYMGLPIEEIIGKSIDEIALKYTMQGSELLQKVLETGEPISGVEMSGEFPEHPGEVSWWLLSYFPINIPGGKREIGIVAVDITGRKRAEEALRWSEEKYRSLFNSIDEGFCICEILIDEQGRPYDYRWLEVNPTWEEQTGLKDPVGRTALELVPNLEKYWFDIFGTVALTGEPIRFQQGSEAMGRWFDVYAFRVGDPGLRQFGILFSDITQRKRAEERTKELNEYLRRQTTQLAATNRELESFSYSISHDLRAPLRTLDGFSTALLEDYADRLDGEGKDYLNRIRSASQRMARLIDDLLQLSRTTRAEIHYTTVNLSEQANSVLEELRLADPDRNVADVIQEGIMAEGDETLLRQVLQNLIGNAWKFTSHTANARIEFGEKRKDNHRIFFVRDNGAGFDMQHAENLFVPFRRLHSDAEFSGTGIGLSIVKRIIERHGGEIWAESEPKKGATLYFTLGG